jgi:hypothetical protein
VFVETVEYKRFVEFCEACRRDRYIGLCYGPPGVAEAPDATPIDTVLFTPEVANTPARIQNDVNRARAVLSSVAKRATRAEQRTTLDALRSRDDARRAEHRNDRDYRPNHPLPLKPTYYEIFN